MEEELKKTKPTPNDYLANERTFLAWVRTGLGIMAFGFVVVKFSFFLKQLSFLLGKEHAIAKYVTNGYSGMLGVLLVVVGVLTVLVSYFSYKSTIEKLNKGEYRYSSLFITILTSLLIFIGALLIIYLIKTM